MFQSLVSCSNKAGESVEVVGTNLYTQVIGFTDSDANSKPIPQDTLLMMTNTEFQKFKDKYFTPRELPIGEPEKEKAVLFIQIASKTSSIETFSVKSLNVKNNTLTVNLKENGIMQLSISKGFETATFKWVMLIQVDKTKLKEDMKIVIKK